MIDKQHILRAIQRISAQNGGNPPGKAAFERETGIGTSEWYPHLYLRWGDALVEAGYPPNRLNTATSNDEIIKSYIALTRELRHLPVAGEVRRKAKTDKSFPSHGVFHRLGGKDKLLEAVLRYCQENPEHEDIVELCVNRTPTLRRSTKADDRDGSRLSIGYVYLMRSGRHYKIGRTNSVGSRQRQLAIQIPVPPTTVHSIETDDPDGVEKYWHRRFAAKRGEGEWFDLSQEDIRAFKRWKRIV